MKLLILAQTPPPLHGQSFMVAQAVQGLPQFGIEVRHVNLALSRNAGEIGNWSASKLWRTLLGAARAKRLAAREAIDALYIIPAPGKRGALWRDFTLLRLLRSSAPATVLHWHTGGTGDWLAAQGRPSERRLAAKLHGNTTLSIVTSPALARDLSWLVPKSVAVVPNGIPDPCPGLLSPAAEKPGPKRILFMGTCSEEKGLLDLLSATSLLVQEGRNVELTLAGSVSGRREQEALARAASQLGPRLRVSGFLEGAAKEKVWSEADLFCLPTHYAHEAQPLVLLEALARDLPIVATLWRGIPDTLPAGNRLVPIKRPDMLAGALREALADHPARGLNRAHFLSEHTREIHLERLAQTLRKLGPQHA